MSRTNYLALVAIALALVAGMAVFAGPSRVAHAHELTLQAGAMLIHKHCAPEVAETFGLEFEVEIAVDVEDPDVGHLDGQYTASVSLACNDVARITADPTPDPSIIDVELSGFFEDFATNGPDGNDNWLNAVFTVTVTEVDPGPWWQVGYEDNDGVTDNDCDFGGVFTTFAPQLVGGYLCTITNTFDLTGLSSVQIEKVFLGEGADPETPFTFSVSGANCVVDIGGTPTLLDDPDVFSITPGQLAEIYCDGPATITELPGPGFEFDSIDNCEAGFVIPDAGGGPSIVFRPPQAEPQTVLCIFINVTSEDSPALANISVSKVCLGEDFDATFEVSIGELVTSEIECNGAPVVATDVEPGDYEISETITGDDAESFITAIVCIPGGALVVGDSTTVTIPADGAVDVSCVLINIFDPDGDDDADGDGIPDDLEDLICSCTCCGVEIDIANENTNVIGVDNANTNTNANNNENENENENTNLNENNNVNTNTQNQENEQDQDNENKQTNNIDASPEINIDLGR